MKKFYLLITFSLFVLGMFGCPRPEEIVSNAANNTISENASENAPEITPTPHRTSKNSSQIAVGNRWLWTESVNSVEGFDRASRAAILHYALELGARNTAENKSLNRPSVKKWLEKELNLAWQNYQSAAKNCQANDWTCIGTTESSADFITKAQALSVPPTLSEWREDIADFVKTYIGEQIRLAGLFPTTSSEIDLFNDNEWDGDKLPDRKFFLTFDDGPTEAGGNTDRVLKMLASEKKTAVFFVIGKNFESRRNKTGGALAKIYQGQCVAAHGWEHLSHEKRSRYAVGDRWQTSVSDTIGLLRQTFDGTDVFLPLFRPPYGQRKPESGEFFQNEGLQVALWNLDSQDWNAQIEAEDIISRIENLMLIKRRGVLLFHDIHPKAEKAVPQIIKDFGNSVEWGDCHQISR